jgi:hypothetical protein
LLQPPTTPQQKQAEAVLVQQVLGWQVLVQ